VSWRPEAGAAARAAAERARLTGEREAEARAELDRLAAERALVAAAEAQAAEARARAAAEQARLEAERAAADRDGDGVPDRLDACPDQPGPAAADPTRNGCPPPPPATAPQAALVKLTAEKIEILQSVQFETDQDVIRPESERLLAEVAGVLSAHPELRLVRVEGHTDAKGSAGHNLALSEKRARAVKRWLVERGGIAVERLDAKGYGPTHPVASNDTAEGRAANRRVEFVIVGPRSCAGGRRRGRLGWQSRPTSRSGHARASGGGAGPSSPAAQRCSRQGSDARSAATMARVEGERLSV
jgi:outer membrane protein OmpA-like peptidoglycan-associated protein